MNKARRKEIADLLSTVATLMNEEDNGQPGDVDWVTFKQQISDAKAAAESIRDDEQDYLDNMPESLQSGEKGSAAQDVIAVMEEAVMALESAEEEAGDSEPALDSVNEHLGDAEGHLQEAAGY
jgi:hypothetical protein